MQKKTVVKKIISGISVPGTGKKKIQQKLDASEAKYKRAFNCTGTGMMILNEDFSIDSINEKITEMTGYAEQDIIGKVKWTTFVAEEDLKWMVPFHEERRKSKTVLPAEYEFRYKHKSGELHYAFVNVSIIPGTTQSLVSLIDINKRYLIEKELRDSHERFRETADLLPAFIVESDLDFKISYANKMALETFGMTIENIDKKKHCFLDFLHPDDHIRARENAIKKRDGNSVTPQEYRLISPNKTELWFLISSTVMYKDNKAIGLRSCLVDITEKKEVEKALLEREEVLRTIFNSSPIGIVLFGEDGEIAEVNNAFSTLFSFPLNFREEKIEYSLLNEFKQFIKQQKKRDIFESNDDFRFVKNGSEWEKIELSDRVFEWHITLLKTANNRLNYLGQVQDITDRKRNDEAKLQDAKSATLRAEIIAKQLRAEIEQKDSFSDIISRSPVMQDIFATLPDIAKADASVFIHGESGTGKELIARSIHNLSDRSSRPLISINCGALPDNLLESELFGYKAGAFTDAKKDKQGKFAMAKGGTLFLDEIGDISLAMQVKLLRVLQEKTYEPLGATKSEVADVRVVTATNKDLSELVKNGSFREDLFYRIKIVTIELPPLRDRKTDIPILAKHFITRFNKQYKKDIVTLSDNALKVLLTHNYPGNIRELENIIERAMIFTKGDTLEATALPQELIFKEGDNSDVILNKIENLADLEKLFITKIIKEEGSKVKAATRLGMHKATLFRKIKSLNIEI